MSDSTDSINTALVILFGILTILATIAGFHVRDSIFCSCFQGIFASWSRNTVIDIEAEAGTRGGGGYRDNAMVYEMQPRMSLPLYYEPSPNEDADVLER